MKNYLIGALAIAVLGLGAFAVMGNKGSSLGALSGPDIASPYISYGGVRHFAARKDSLTAATTTVCALQSPASTSTLEFSTFKLDAASTTGAVVTVAKASTPYATTTWLANMTLTSGAGDSIVVMPTSTAGTGATASNFIFAPNTYLVVGVAGGAGGANYTPTGYCAAEWIQL